MRAPPESLMPITGAPTLVAVSRILQIFSACASLNEPPKTVKSWLNTNTNRPLIVTVAGDDTVTRDFLIGHAEVVAAVLDEHIPFFEAAFVEQTPRCVRAPVSLPLACCAAMRFSPPPSRA
jgi:hypothetical protein